MTLPTNLAHSFLYVASTILTLCIREYTTKLENPNFAIFSPASMKPKRPPFVTFSYSQILPLFTTAIGHFPPHHLAFCLIQFARRFCIRIPNVTRPFPSAGSARWCRQFVSSACFYLEKCKNRVFVSGFSFSSVVFISLFLFLLHFLKCQYVIISSIVTILIIIIYLIYIFIYLPIHPFVILLPSILTKSYSLNYVTKLSPASCTSRPPPSPSTPPPPLPFPRDAISWTEYHLWPLFPRITMRISSLGVLITLHILSQLQRINTYV